MVPSSTTRPSAVATADSASTIISFFRGDMSVAFIALIRTPAISSPGLIRGVFIPNNCMFLIPYSKLKYQISRKKPQKNTDERRFVENFEKLIFLYYFFFIFYFF